MGAVRIRHSIREFATQPVILWILLGGKPKWLPLNFGFNDVMRTAPIAVIKKTISIAQDHGQLLLAERRLAGSIDCNAMDGSLLYEQALVLLWQSSWKRLRTADGKFTAWKKKDRLLFSAKSRSMTESHKDMARELDGPQWPRSFSGKNRSAHQSRGSCKACLQTWKLGGTWGAWGVSRLPLLIVG